MTNGLDGRGPAKRGDLFISRAGADKELAILIAHLLRQAGYITFLQDEDFGHTNFMARMREGFAKVDNGGRMVTLLSRAYMQSDYCMAEADFALTGDPSNKKQRLIVLRIEGCAATGFLKGIPWAYNLVPILHDATALAQAVRGAIDPAAPEANYAAGLKYATTQILHPEIHPVPGFTGRENLLDAIDRALWQKGGAAALANAQSAAVHGLGGVGKSVLAQEYAWRNRARYRGVWWLRAETEQTLLDDLIALGSRLIPGLAEIPERGRATRLALDAIEQTAAEKPWLLVYDNAEKPGTIRKLKPRERTHILITSRWPDWQDDAQELAVDVFAAEVAVDYLLAKRPHETCEAAGRLADALGYLPLALSHARAYCAETNLSFDDYARRLSGLIQEAPEDAEYPASVFATFSLAIAKAAEACPEAEKLMAIAAFLAPERIPLDIITADIMSEGERDKALRRLSNVSLIAHDRLNDGSRAISVHRLIQEATRVRQGDWGNVVVLLTLDLIHAALDTVAAEERTEWHRIDRLFSHAVRVTELADALGNGPATTADVLTWLDLYCCTRGDYASAEFYSDRALAIRERLLSPDHLDIGMSLHNLALIYEHQGCYEKAEFMFKRALPILEGNLGRDHPDIGAILGNLADLIRAQGRYEEAEPLLKRAHEIIELTLGSNHPRTGMLLHNLALLYHGLKRYEEAESLYQRSIAICEIALGPNHSEVALALGNLALLYRAQGRHDTEPLFRRALEIAEETLGADHPDTGIHRLNLASLYNAQGRYDQAKPLIASAMDTFERRLGPDHPYTKNAKTGYDALEYNRLGRFGWNKAILPFRTVPCIVASKPGGARARDL